MGEVDSARPVTPFLTLDELRLPPALATAVTVFLVTGLLHLGRRLARVLGCQSDDTLATCTGFVVVVGVLGALVHGAALAQVLELWWLRGLGAIVVVCGLVEVVSRMGQLRGSLNRGTSVVVAGSLVDRTSFLAAIAVLGLTTVAALGAPTDIDSLNYHLGVPLEWLRQGGAVDHPEWLSARLIGLGEMVSLVGLAMGTDTVSGALQATSLIAVAVAIGSVAGSPQSRALAWLLVAASPQAVTLTMTQKPQMLPAVGVVLAILIAADRRGPLTRSRIWMASGAIMCAVGSKYIFLLSGLVASAALVLASRRVPKGAQPFAALALCACLLPLTVFVRNMSFYGDPVSPFLEHLHAAPDPAVVGFAEWLSHLGSGRSPRDLALLPLRFIGSRSLAGLPMAMGLGLLAIVFVRFRKVTVGALDSRFLIASTGAVSLVILVAGRLQPRDFMEVYLLAACAAVVALRASVLSDLWRFALLGQAAVTLGLVAYGAVRMAPTAILESSRQAYMQEAADEYTAARWLAQVVPGGAVQMAELRAAALFERPFVSFEYARFLATTDLPMAEKTTLLRRIVGCRGITHLALRSPVDVSVLEPLGDLPGTAVAGPQSFRWTARNPWSRGSAYDMVVREIGTLDVIDDRHGCP